MSRFAKKGFAKLKLLAKFETPLYNNFFAVLVSKLSADKGGSDNSSLTRQRAWELLLPEQKCFL